MSTPIALIILILLLLGPMVNRTIEHNLEAWCFILGVLAVTLARKWDLDLVGATLRAPLSITIAVAAAGFAFAWLRPVLERRFAHLRAAAARPVLTAVTVLAIAIASSLVTVVVAALVLVEVIGMLHLARPARVRVTVAACFAVGIGSTLTPAGGPFSAIVADAMNLRFFDLALMLGGWLSAGMVVTSALAGFFARGAYDPEAGKITVHEDWRDVLVQGLKIFGFVAGLALVSAAYAPLAARWLPRVGVDALFWVDTISAALDNATLAAVEAHGVNAATLRPALLSMIIAGGMLIPGNIPNIVCAGILGIDSTEWARIGLPIGLTMLGICFALLKFGF